MNNPDSIIAKLFATCLVSAIAVSAHAESRFLTNALFAPGETLRLAEASGRITIYDGLRNETVDKALDEQFERIENMMFVRTRVIQEDGSYEAEEDCD